MRDAFQAVPAWTDHLEENASLKARLDRVFGTAGLDAWASWCVYNLHLVNPALRYIFAFHEMIRRPLFRLVDRAYMSWPPAPVQQSREQHMHLRERRRICFCNRRFRIQVVSCLLVIG